MGVDIDEHLRDRGADSVFPTILSFWNHCSGPGNATQIIAFEYCGCFHKRKLSPNVTSLYILKNTDSFEQTMPGTVFLHPHMYQIRDLPVLTNQFIAQTCIFQNQNSTCKYYFMAPLKVTL